MAPMCKYALVRFNMMGPDAYDGVVKKVPCHHLRGGDPLPDLTHVWKDLDSYGPGDVKAYLDDQPWYQMVDLLIISDSLEAITTFVEQHTVGFTSTEVAVHRGFNNLPRQPLPVGERLLVLPFTDEVNN